VVAVCIERCTVAVRDASAAAAKCPLGHVANAASFFGSSVAHGCIDTIFMSCVRVERDVKDDQRAGNDAGEPSDEFVARSP